MSVGAKRAKATQGATLDPTSWLPLTRRPAPEKLTLLEVMGGVWTFQDPGNDRLYRCEIDPGGTERWFFKAIRTESELISQSDAARLIGVSRQAIRSSIVYERLRTVNCNGRPLVHRVEVLALQIDPKRGRARKQSRRS
jgi:hypothetical protein